MKSVLILVISVLLVLVSCSSFRKYDDNERVYFWPKRMILTGNWQLARIASSPAADDPNQTIDTADATFNAVLRINNFEYCELFNGDNDNRQCQNWEFIKYKEWIKLTNPNGGAEQYRRIIQLDRNVFAFTMHVAIDNEPLVYMAFEKAS